MMRLLACAILAALTLPATAQTMPMAAPVCPKDAEPLPAALAGWTEKVPLIAAQDSMSVAAAAITPGGAVDVGLVSTPAVTYIAQPSHPGDAASYGGMLSLAVATAGTYRIAVGSAAWVDLVRGQTLLNSVGHGRGPACSGIRKMVDFEVPPGSYVLQIVGNTEPRIPVLVVKLR